MSNRWPKGATVQYGVRFGDGSVASWWNGRTARRRAGEAAAAWDAEAIKARGELLPIDTHTVVVRNGPADAWRPVGDWLTDPALSDEAKLARWEDLEPVEVVWVCLYCDEPVTADDGHESIRVGRADGSVSLAVAHRECSLRQVLGGPAHLLGRCTCQGGTDDPDMGMSPRDAARWVRDALRERSVDAFGRDVTGG